jgi:hypothetical protein
MKAKFLKAAVVAAVAAAGFASTGAQAATASANANAQILAPVTLVNNLSLEFGTVVPDTVGGNVSISTGGVRSCGGALVCGGTFRAAEFEVNGTDGFNVVVSIPVTSTTLTSGANSMAVNSLSASSGLITLTAGADLFTVGGTLVVGANQAAGVYTGTFNVSADYQ